MKSRRGFTVLEALIYSVLSFVLLGGVTMYIHSGLRIYRGGESYRNLQKDAMLTMHRLTKDITNSTAAKEAGGQRIALPPGNENVIVFCSADALSTNPAFRNWSHDPTTGDLLWRKWVFFQHKTEEMTLLRHELEFDPTSEPDLPLPPTPDAFSGPAQVVGRQVERVTLSWLEPQEALDVHLVVSSPSKTGTLDGTRIELRTSVHIEN